MKNFTLTTLSIFIFHFCISISFTFQPGIVLASNVQGSQNPDLSDFKKQLDAMEETIKKQQEMINALKDKIESKETVAHSSVSKIETNAIEQVIDDYLTKDNTREKMIKAGLSPNLEMGYKKGFYFKTLDDKFKLNTLGRLQTRYNFRNNDDGEDTSSYRINRMRLKLSGHAFTQNLRYSAQWELNTFTGRGQLKDIFVDYRLLPGLHLRGGQWKVPYNRQNVASDYKKQFIDESITNDAFSLDRDIGIMLHGELFNNYLEYYAGMFTGRGINATENSNNKNMVIGRIAYRPFGKFNDYWETDAEYTESFKAAFGAAFAINNGTEIFFSNELQTFSKDAQFMQFGLDSIMKFRGFSLQGEYHLRRLDRRGFNRDTANGFFVQGGYFPVPKRLEIVARYAQFDPDVNVSENLEKEFALGTNWYFSKNHHHKLQANVTRFVTDNPANDKEDTLISIMHQIEW
ncbi:MAG: hypothetical protein ACUZ8N_02395 [Candidatus Scalindua sp.]